QPLVLEEPEAVEVFVGLDFLAGIPVETAREVEPERRAGRGIEVPGHGLAHVGVEGVFGEGRVSEHFVSVAGCWLLVVGASRTRDRLARPRTGARGRRGRVWRWSRC